MRLPMPARPLLAGALCTAGAGAVAAAAAAQTPAPPATSTPVAGAKARIVVQARRRTSSPAAAPRSAAASVPAGRGFPSPSRRAAAGAGGRSTAAGPARGAATGCATASAPPSAPASGAGRSGLGVRGGSRAVGRLNVYRFAHASWYGPGLYGNRLGCGGTLSPGTLGVANKTLPCGTKVTLRHGGRTVRVPVIDRGPYVAGREYDLTAATAQRLGFRGHGALLRRRS